MDDGLKVSYGGDTMSDELQGEVTGDVVNITQGGAQQIKGTTVTVRQGGAQSITADNLVIRQGGAARAQAQHLELVQGGVGLAQTETASLTASRAGLVLARGDVTLNQGMAPVLFARGGVTMDQGGAGVLISREVKADNSGVVFLLARQVEGQVRAVFGPREAVIFGAVAGMVAGMMILVSREVRKRKQGADGDKE